MGNTATKEELFTKQEAADYLGVSTRAIERYSQKGKLTVEYHGGKTRPVSHYRKSELDAIKADLESVSVRPAVISSPLPATLSQHVEKLVSPIDENIVRAILQNLATPRDPVAIESKLLLTLTEARHLSGLSREHLIEAIRAGTLKAQKIGKGWKVKRMELERYVARL